jgi:pilus assembly protein FimV
VVVEGLGLMLLEENPDTDVVGEKDFPGEEEAETEGEWEVVVEGERVTLGDGVLELVPVARNEGVLEWELEEVPEGVLEGDISPVLVGLGDTLNVLTAVEVTQVEEEVEAVDVDDMEGEVEVEEHWEGVEDFVKEAVRVRVEHTVGVEQGLAVLEMEAEGVVEVDWEVEKEVLLVTVARVEGEGLEEEEGEADKVAPPKGEGVVEVEVVTVGVEDRDSLAEVLPHPPLLTVEDMEEEEVEEKDWHMVGVAQGVEVGEAEDDREALVDLEGEIVAEELLEPESVKLPLEDCEDERVGEREGVTLSEAVMHPEMVGVKELEEVEVVEEVMEGLEVGVRRGGVGEVQGEGVREMEEEGEEEEEVVPLPVL